MNHYCTECGHELQPGAHFCISCGAATTESGQAQEDLHVPAISAPTPHPPEQSAKSKAPLALLVVTATLAAGAAYWFVIRSPSSHSPSQPIAAESPTDSSPSQPDEDAAVAAEPVPMGDPRATRTLTSKQAIAELDEAARSGRTELHAVAGQWVTQLSSKCVGMSTPYLDLGIKGADGWSYVPDGNFDDVKLTPNHIAAYHRAMSREFGAVTVRYRDLSSKRLIDGCTDPRAWVSFIPQPKRGPAGALAVCDRLGLPPNDCFAARYPVGGSGQVEQKTTT